jgi:hypothetical protein
MTMKTSTETMLSGPCFCGAVKWQSTEPMLWAALCHCEDCRRAASSDYVSWFGVKQDAVLWHGPGKSYAASQKVIRSFCGDCGAPTSFESQIFPDETHLYAAPSMTPALIALPRIFFGRNVYLGRTSLMHYPSTSKGYSTRRKAGKNY